MKHLNVSGKRKRAVAKAVINSGRGVVKVNGKLIEFYQPELARLKLQEPLLIASGIAGDFDMSETQSVSEHDQNTPRKARGGFDISVTVSGGGLMSQAEAARLAIAKALVRFTKDKKLEKAFLDYDRHLLVADVRRREARKPNRHGKARSKRQKSYR